MSTYIHHEIFLLIRAVLTGAVLFLCYDFLRALRKVLPHSGAAVSMEDLLYWTACGIAVFAQVYRNNQGILRFFMILGIVTGAAFCEKTAGDIFEKCMIHILKIPVIMIKKITKWLLFPVRRCKLFKYRDVKKERLANWGILRKRRKKEK